MNPEVYLDKGGVIGILLFIVISLLAGWWEPKRTIERSMKERDEEMQRLREENHDLREELAVTQDQLYRALGVAGKAVTSLKKRGTT